MAEHHPFTPERLPERRRARQPQMTQIVAYSPKMFEEAYHIGHAKLYEEINSGRLIARKIGKLTIILASDAEAWAESLPRAGCWNK